MSNLNLNTISSLDTGREVDVNRVMQTVDYVGGLVIDSRDTVIVDGDDRYVLAANTALPYTTTGAGMPEGGDFVSVGDAALRQELANDGGVSLVSGSKANFDCVADMKAASWLKLGMDVETASYLPGWAATELGPSGGNEYKIVPAGTGSDDGGFYIDLPASGLQAKAKFKNNTIKITQYGADPSGASESSTAINRSLYLAAIRGGATVLAEDGQYLLNSQLYIGSNTSFISGVNTLFRKNHLNTFMQTRRKNDGGLYGLEDIPSYGGTKNISIIGGVWDGFSEGIFDGYTGFAVGFTSNFLMQDVTLLNMIIGGHGVDLCASKDVKFKNCKFLGVATTGKSPDTSEIIQLDHNVAGSFPGVYFGNPTFDQNVGVKVIDCEFGPNPENTDPRFGSPFIGVGAHGSVHNEWHKNVIIKRCNFVGSRYAGIRPWKINNLKVSNCTFDGGGRGLHFTASPAGSVSSTDRDGVQSNQAQAGYGATIDKCTFSNLTDMGVFTSDPVLGTDVTVRHEGIVVSKCDFLAGNYQPVRFRGARSVSVLDCKAVGTGQFLYCTDGTEKVVVKGCDVSQESTSDYGGSITLSGVNVFSVEGNILADSPQRAIHMTSTCLRGVVSGNVITNQGVDNSLHPAIVVQSNSKYITIANNDITNPSPNLVSSTAIHASTSVLSTDIVYNNVDGYPTPCLHHSVGGIACLRLNSSMGSSPEGVVVAQPGSVCHSVSGKLYVKESGTGSTGWVAK